MAGAWSRSPARIFGAPTYWPAPRLSACRERGRVVHRRRPWLSVYAKHGTTVETRLTVIDKIPADSHPYFGVPGTAPDIATLDDVDR